MRRLLLMVAVLACAHDDYRLAPDKAAARGLATNDQLAAQYASDRAECRQYAAETWTYWKSWYGQKGFAWNDCMEAKGYVRAGAGGLPEPPYTPAGRVKPGMGSIGTAPASEVPRASQGSDAACVQQCQRINLDCGGPTVPSCNALLRDCYGTCVTGSAGFDTE